MNVVIQVLQEGDDFHLATKLTPDQTIIVLEMLLKSMIEKPLAIPVQ